MTSCPHCGEEIKEHVTYCPKCGELLDTDTAERTTLIENIRFAIDAIRNNPSVFVPEILLTLASAIGGQFFGKLYGEEVFQELSDVAMAGGDLTPYYPIFKVAAAYIVAGIVLDLLLQPFLQHVYLDVVEERGVDLGRSFNNTMNRLGEYIIAQLTVISVPVVILAGGYIIIGDGPIDEIPSWLGGAFLLIVFLVIVMYFLSLGSQIMVWEGEGFTASIRLGLDFFQRRIGTLIALSLVNIVIGGILMSLPLSSYTSFILNVFNGIVTIDIYQNYRKMGK